MLLIAMLVACTDGKDTGEDVVGVVADGGALYTSNCVGCHGADGAGTDTYPSLVEEVPGLADTEIEEVVLNGKEAMPAYEFDTQEMADMLAYLRATFG
ncbi:MAG: cytochrome c [Pseudomonadota bacterium]|nr:cytochrome c [Pseudomonadota bacterium]